MVDLLSRPHSLVETYEATRPLLQAVGPAELDALRLAAFRKFEAVGLPTTKDEEFKYTSLRPIAETTFSPGYGATVTHEDLGEFSPAFFSAPRLVFVNGQYAPELSDLRGLAREVTLTPLNEALDVQPANVMKYLGAIATLGGKLGSTNDERFSHLNFANLAEGAYLNVPAGVNAEAPIHLVFVSKADHGPFAAHPRVLVTVGEGASATVVEAYVGLSGSEEYLTNAVTEVRLDTAARLDHTRIQLEAPKAFHIATVAAHQEADSTWNSTVVSFGGAISRVDLNLWLNGEQTESWLNGAGVGAGEQLIDHHTRIDHAKPNCNSFEVYKTVLADKSSGVFNGKIFVYEDAQKTDAKQTNQALLLSKTASIDTKPQLEIFADDVKCTHGATVGQLRDDALFYLRSRGIPAAEAKALLVQAFVAEAFAKIGDEPVREALETILRAKLGDSK